jgi:thymidylate synthase (FAD)
MMSGKLTWITPHAEDLIVYIARVSNPQSQTEGKNKDKLIKYLIDHRHWSPFEMVSACIEINTTRDIARQMLRHRSFSFQEFSQRYQTIDKLSGIQIREARLQDQTNRQNSIETEDQSLHDNWRQRQLSVFERAETAYKWAIEQGLAKEVARAVLPEGLTHSRLYMAGTIRSWLHYCQTRYGSDTQKEHREIAQEINNLLSNELPFVFKRPD